MHKPIELRVDVTDEGDSGVPGVVAVEAASIAVPVLVAVGLNAGRCRIARHQNL
jgi:hypothetical protein